MKSYFTIAGMTCQSCVARVRHALLKIPEVKEVSVSLENRSVEIEADKKIPVSGIRSALLPAGEKYQVIDDKNLKPEKHSSSKSSFFSVYKPLILVFIYISLVSWLAEAKDGHFSLLSWMNYFMAGFFLVFSFFKLIDIRAFAVSYSTYDLPARYIPGYAYAYPFLELGLGIGYLLEINTLLVNFFTLILMGISSIGVIQSLINKKEITCACLGAVFKLPMSYLTLFEDLLMVCMSGFMLLHQAGI
jgi:copper chaperone CopZ